MWVAYGNQITLIYLREVCHPVIRRGTLADLQTIHRIEKKCFGRRSFSKAHIMWMLKSPTALTFLYARDGADVGAIMLKREEDIARVVSIAVLPGRRRAGFGTELMKQAEEVMRDLGAQVMKLEVSVNNQGAIDFYKALGYELDGVLRGYYSWGEDAYVMAKPLDMGGG